MEVNFHMLWGGDQIKRKYKEKYNDYNITTYDYGICYANGKEILFDLEDYKKIKNYSWQCKCTKKGYCFVMSQVRKTRVVMSRLIMGCDDSSLQVDHINHNTLDNRKRNLRIVTVSQNNMNKDIRSDNTSGHSGVSFNKKSGKYVSYIKINQKRIHLGSFIDINDAIKAREDAEEKYFKEYSYKNSNKLQEGVRGLCTH